MKFCIAGKNEIALYGVELLLSLGIEKSNIFCLVNKTDSGNHTWQPSFKKFCIDNNLLIVQQSDLYAISDLIFISLEYDQIIKTKQFLSDKLYNIHFSLLPAYKGMFTSILPIMKGETYSGVTLHKIDDGIDTGDIIDQIKFDIPFGITGYGLYLKYLFYSKKLLRKNILNILNSFHDSIKQPILNSSYYAKNEISFDDFRISFYKTCFEVCNFVNAFSFRPYQLPEFKGHKIVKAFPSEQRSSGRPGIVVDEAKYTINVSTIDYNVRLLKNNLDETLITASNNDIENIKYFHSLGYPLDEKNNRGWSPLIVASYHGGLEVVKYLVETCLIDINQFNNNGTTVLMYAMTYAVKTDDLSILEFLIQNGADINQKDFFGKGLKEYALEYKNQTVIQYLNKY